MSSSTEKAHKTCGWPQVVVRDSIVSPKLGTEANPILIGDDLAPLGSFSNPIVIHVDEGWCRDETDQLDSDADTEIMATQESWGTLIGGNFAVPVGENAAVDSSSVRASTTSPVCEDPECLQLFEQSTPNCFYFDEKALKTTENSFDASQNCSGLETRSENVANGHAGTFS
jgi:hypothetical protein